MMFLVKVNCHFRSTLGKCSTKKGALKNFAVFTGKHMCWSLFLLRFNKLYQKETPTQVFSCEYFEIFKAYFEEHLRRAASAIRNYDAKKM